jgi:uncharacterized membrane protein
MKTLLKFIKTTIIGGLLFLIPLVLVLVVIGKAYAVVNKIVAPIAAHLPFGGKDPGLVAAWIAIGVLLLVAFLAGLVARTRFGQRVRRGIENVVLKKIPGYTLLKSMTDNPVDSADERMQVALANIDDAWLLAFIMEELEDGRLTVFVPSAPTPVAGSLYYLQEEQVRRLKDVAVRDAVACIMQLGVGSRKLLGQAGLAGSRPQAQKTGS